MQARLEELARQLERAAQKGGPTGLLARAASLLAELRPTDEQGGASALANRPDLLGLAGRGAGAGAALAGEIVALAGRRGCIRCGACCRTASPTLYQSDRELVEQGGIKREWLFGLRAGERVGNARLGQSQALERDLVKMVESAPGVCLHLAARGCAIHRTRPLQCRHLECWSGQDAGQLAGEPRLAPADLFAGDQTALALKDEYDRKLPAGELAGLFQSAARGDREAAARALEFIELDARLRQGIQGRYGYEMQQQALLLGRPALVVAAGHGLALRNGPRGAPELAPTRPPAAPKGTR